MKLRNLAAIAIASYALVSNAASGKYGQFKWDWPVAATQPFYSTMSKKLEKLQVLLPKSERADGNMAKFVPSLAINSRDRLCHTLPDVSTNGVGAASWKDWSSHAVGKTLEDTVSALGGSFCYLGSDKYAWLPAFNDRALIIVRFSKGKVKNAKLISF